MRKLVKGSGFKMLSPLKLDNQTVTSEEKNKDASIVQVDQTDSGHPWSTLTAAEIKALEGSGNRPPEQLYKGQRVYPNENVAWQTPEQAEETEIRENSQSTDYPDWENKISEDEKNKLAELKANTLTNPRAHSKVELAYYNSLKTKYKN
tara:strand:+ start:2308 stop:2754 length:447 start_codon:yes stop_codon:yes gene_type:complete